MEEQADAKSSGGKLNGHRNAVVVAVVSAILGSTGAPFILVKLGVNPFRPGAYTNAMAEARQNIVDHRFAALEAHVSDHGDEEWRDAILELQRESAGAAKEREQMLRNQDRILDRLERIDK